VLSDTGLTGDLLDLELTESMVMRDIDSAIQKMDKLRQAGIRISVDDFGTGYSSLGYLPKLPLDILKIDRCFVAQIGENDAAVPLIHGMISLAHSIGKRVIVEGVETAGQLEILRNLNCDEVQGFLLGRPARLMRHDERPQEIATEQLIA
jgi:EAL domain-containing protein (putative c-di-GMP-specific phosphodiesterase class I)